MNQKQKTFTLYTADKSARQVVLNFASFEDGMNLMSAIWEVASKQETGLVGLPQERLVMAIRADKKVNEAVLKCLEKCTYQGEAITHTLRNTSMDLVGHYYTIFQECVEFYSSFFFPQLPLDAQ